jgi:Tol biopolymer transport system component
LSLVLALAAAFAGSCNMPLGTSTPAAATPQPQGAMLLLFASSRNDNQDLFLEDPTSGEVQRLTQDPAADGVAVWSPDGLMIAFVRFAEDGSSEIHITDASGSNDRQVTHLAGASQILPSWSPDGRQLVYASVTGTGSEIFILSIDGSGARQLPTGPLTRPNDPLWSPDGSTIAFTAGDPTRALYVVSGEGGEPRQLTQPNAQLSINWPLMWAPDGSRLAFTAPGSTGKSEIFVVARDGAGLVALTAGDGNSRSPAWSPDGSQLSFWSDRDGGDFYVVSSAGGPARRLTTESGISASDVAIAWSPDGSKLAVWSAPDSPPARIFLIDLAPRTVRPLPGDEGDDFPALWRPLP